jgi:capsular polysaccharide transport system ATP-binding protein
MESIQIKKLNKSYKTNVGKKHILRDLNLDVRKGEKIGILGNNGAGKSTLIRIIAGIEYPDSGYINTNMSVSWPLGYNGGMQGSLSGYDNIKFLSRIYDANAKEITSSVDEFSELGKALSEPVKTYSTGMKGRLNFSLSLAFDFECLLIDEGLTAGDSYFSNKCKRILEEKEECSIIMVSHSEDDIRQFCTKAYVLKNGSIIDFETIDEAFQFYNFPCHVHQKINP